jgi:hypothetical protein
VSLPTPDDFELHPYDIDAEEDDEPGGDCTFPPDEAA